MSVAVFNGLRDGLAVRNLWLSYLELNTVSTAQNVNLNVEVKFAHSFKNSLTRVFIRLNTE